jgi:hypothetical protein
MGDVFTTVLQDPVEPTNTLLGGDRCGPPGRPLARRGSRPAGRPAPGRRARRPRLRPARRGGLVYTDDTAPPVEG